MQLGGGIRDLDTIEKYLDAGISHVIIGTAAVKNPGFLKDACAAFDSHIIVGLDAREGRVATVSAIPGRAIQSGELCGQTRARPDDTLGRAAAGGPSPGPARL